MLRRGQSDRATFFAAHSAAPGWLFAASLLLSIRHRRDRGASLIIFMQSPVLTTIAATGFTVAFFHAAIPTHWLPFVLVARARAWSRAKALSVVLLAGTGHVLVTTVLGLAIAWFGFELDARFGRAFPWLAGGLLFAFAAFYVFRQWRGEGICHHHPPGTHHHADPHCGEDEEHSHLEEELRETPLLSRGAGELSAISGLFVMLTLSPCEGFLPVYLSGIQFGWRGFFVLSVILAVAALGAMTLLTWLALIGYDKLRVQRFERYEAGALGALFAVLGTLVILLER